MYGYIYITTNLITNKIYIGQKKSQRFCPTYFGSGKIIKKSLKKYGTINHKVELIVWSESSELSNMFEKFWIKTYDATNKEIGMNISAGGNTNPWNKGIPCSDEAKQKISNSKKGKKKSDETKLKMSISKTGTKMNAEFSLKMSKLKKGNTNMLGKKHSNEAKNKMSISRKGITTNNKPIIIDDIYYISLKQASLLLEIPASTLRRKMINICDNKYTLNKIV